MVAPVQAIRDPDIQWPSIPLLYEYVPTSYSSMLTVLQDVGNKSRALLQIAGATTVGTPIFVRAVFGDSASVMFQSGWFVGAITSFVAALICGLALHLWGNVRIPDPNAMYDQTSLSEDEFMQRACFYAAQDFVANRRMVNVKGHLVNILSAFLLIEIVFLVIWIMDRVL